MARHSDGGSSDKRFVLLLIWTLLMAMMIMGTVLAILGK